MKKLIAIALMLVLCLSACAKKDANNAPADTTIPENGVVHEYDPDTPDRKTATITYENGVEISRDSYEYGEDGNIKSVQTVKDGKTTQKTTYEYEENKMSQSIKEFSDEGIDCKEISEFDEKGHLVATTYYENGEKSGREVYSYDENDQMIRADKVDDEGNVLTYNLYTYDAGGKIVRVDYYEFDALALYYEYTYKNGTIDVVKCYDSNGNLLSENK